MIFVAILFAEAVLLFLGQRRIFPRVAARSWTLALFLAAPGTALHEGAHWIACKLLAIPVGRVELFRPRRDEDGVRLGVVEHGKGGSIEMTVVAIAPLLLVPPMLVGLAAALFGSGIFSDPWSALTGAAIWKQLIFSYLLLSAGWAAFPSPGDHIPPVGAAGLVILLVLIGYLLGLEKVLDLVRLAALVLAPAAVSALLQLLLVTALDRSGRGGVAVPGREKR